MVGMSVKINLRRPDRPQAICAWEATSATVRNRSLMIFAFVQSLRRRTPTTVATGAMPMAGVLRLTVPGS